MIGMPRNTHSSGWKVLGIASRRSSASFQPAVTCNTRSPALRASNNCSTFGINHLDSTVHPNDACAQGTSFNASATRSVRAPLGRASKRNAARRPRDIALRLGARSRFLPRSIERSPGRLSRKMRVARAAEAADSRRDRSRWFSRPDSRRRFDAERGCGFYYLRTERYVHYRGNLTFSD